ncbi:ribosomal protein L21-like protein [Morchella snyderi]|nr:ribosomal protein L21-like protein [Morchella snyderi]
MLLRALQRTLRPLAALPTAPVLAPLPTTTTAATHTLRLLRGLTTTPHLHNLSQTPLAPSTPTVPQQTGTLNITPAGPATPHPSLALITALKAQPAQYITIHIHKFPFLVTVGDLVRLPFRLKDVGVGDTLRITHASVLGSRDYTLKGSPYIDPALFECRARVVEETSEPMRVKEKTKRRNRRIKKVKSKHRYTVLRISELVVKDAPVVAAAAAAGAAV